jgi:VWFA-related protein
VHAALGVFFLIAPRRAPVGRGFVGRALIGRALVAAMAGASIAGAPIAPAAADVPGLPPPPAPASPCRVAILHPGDRDLLYGPTTLLAAATCPPGASPAEIEFFVDGRPAGTTRGPRFAVTWDAGGAFEPHVVVARLRDTDGRTDAVVVTTPGAAVQESVRVAAVPPDLVELSVSVTDRDGRPLRGLTASDFVVEEEGRRRELLAARPDERPLSLALLVDVSSSLRAFWPVLGGIAPKLARALRPGDALRVVAFSGPAYLVQEFTADPERVARSMDRFSHWGGGTSLYDTLAAVGTEMAWSRDGRQAVVLITDGIDTLSRIDPSRLRDYLRRTPLVVETFLTRPQSAGPAPPGRYARALESMSRETGGTLRRVAGADDMEAAFRELAGRLQDRYYLAWRSDEAARGGWRSIKVRVRGRDAVVLTRRGIIGRRPVGDFLLADLRSGDAAARVKAAEWLGGLPVEGAPAGLLAALDDRSAPVRAAAAMALGRIREPRAIEPLVAMLREPIESDRVAAGEALLSFGPTAVPALLAALDGAGAHQQSEILNVLAGIADPRAAAAVVVAAMPPAPPMMAPGGADPAIDARSRRERAATRLWALETLGRLPIVESLPALEKGARDRDPAMREAALASLARQATPAAFAVLRGLGGAAGGAEELRTAARAALASGYAALAGDGRLGEWIAELRGAAEFLETMTVATFDATGGWDGVIAAVGGRAAAAALLEDLARRLPAPGSGRARALATRLQPPPG